MKYYSDWKNTLVDCRFCKWAGVGEDTKQGELYSTFVERICPQCGENIFLLETVLFLIYIQNNRQILASIL